VELVHTWNAKQEPTRCVRWLSQHTKTQISWLKSTSAAALQPNHRKTKQKASRRQANQILNHTKGNQKIVCSSISTREQSAAAVELEQCNAENIS
jgi:hypothetical protein